MKIFKNIFHYKSKIVNTFLVLLAFGSVLYSLKPIIMWAMLFVIAIISVFNMKDAVMNRHMHFWLFYLTWILVGVFYTKDQSYAIGYIIKIVILFISLLCVGDTVDIKKEKKLLYIMTLLGVLSIIVELFNPGLISDIREKLQASQSLSEKIMLKMEASGAKYGIFSDTATAAFFSASGVGLALVMFGEKKLPTAIMLSVLSVWAIVLTQKRGPMIALGVSLLILYIVCSALTTVQKLRAIFVVLFIVLGCYIAYNSISALSSWINKLNWNEASTENRTWIYEELWKNFKEHPWTGSGTKSTRYLFNGLDAHNIYLGALSENGIPGFVLLVTALITSLLATIKTMYYFKFENLNELQYITVYCVFGQMYFISYGMTGNPMTDIYLLSFYFLCLGVPMRLERYVKRNKSVLGVQNI